MTAKITIITATSPARLSKAFSLDASGHLQKHSGGVLTRGNAEVREIGGLEDLAEVLASLTPAQALVFGAPKNGAGGVMARRAFLNAGMPAGFTTRTNAAFAWPQGAGVLMNDHDASLTGTALDRAALVEAIRAAAPGLTDAAILWTPSASSCIWHGSMELRGVLGQRLYLLALDASDIPRAGKALVDRLWLAGHGHIEVSASGALLERTIVDSSVWQPSRLDFAGGAACGAGLEQRRGVPAVISGTVEFINTRAAIPDLTEAERAELTAIKLAAKAAVKVEAEGVKSEWIAARAQEMVAPDKKDVPDAVKRAETIARRALEGGTLGGDFIVHVEIGGAVEAIPVGRLLDNREKFHGCLTRDPLEPAYDGGRLVGRLFLMQARPSLHSFAHGGRTYRLHRAPDRVELVRGQTADAANRTIELLRRDPTAFDFGGQLAVADGGRVHPLCEHGLAHHLGGTTQFWKYVQQGDNLIQVDCDPPGSLLKQVIAQGERRRLNPLDAVISGPTIRLDGSVLDRPGYDTQTRLLFEPLGDEPRAIPDKPTLEDAAAVVETLMRPFATFPFVDATARGAMLAAILTAVVRPVLPTSPAFAFDAPIQGSGKSLLASCVGALADGRTPDIWPHTQGRDDEETRKRLFTALRTGSRTLVWDNVTGVFDSASMAAFITADAMVDRVLGKSESIRIPNRAMLILTGNNMSLAGDMPRRVIICRIDPETDQPFARQFALDPLAHVLEHRGEMMAAVCVLIRARFVHMDKPAPGRLASFEAWDDLVRQTVCWADQTLMPGRFGDPMDLVREAQAADPEADALFALLDALREQFATAEFTAKAAQSAAKSSMIQSPLELALLDIAGDRALSSVKSLGRVLKFREGRIVHGLRLVGRLDTASGTRLYRVKSEIPGFNGYNGFRTSHTEKARPSHEYGWRETNPPNPPNPENDVFGAEW